MEVTGVTGRTWTCEGNGGVIKYVADVISIMWWLFYSQTEGRNWKCDKKLLNDYVYSKWNIH